MTNSNSFPRHIFLRSAAAAFLFAFAAIMPAEGKEISVRKALGIAKRYVTLEKKAYTAPRTRSVTGSALRRPLLLREPQEEGNEWLRCCGVSGTKMLPTILRPATIIPAVWPQLWRN